MMHSCNWKKKIPRKVKQAPGGPVCCVILFRDAFLLSVASQSGYLTCYNLLVCLKPIWPLTSLEFHVRCFPFKSPTVWGLYREIFPLSMPQRKKSAGVGSGGRGGQSHYPQCLPCSTPMCDTLLHLAGGNEVCSVSLQNVCRVRRNVCTVCS